MWLQKSNSRAVWNRILSVYLPVCVQIGKHCCAAARTSLKCKTWKERERGRKEMEWNRVECSPNSSLIFRATKVKFRGANQLFKVAPFLFDLEKTTSRWLLLIWKNKVKCLEALLLTLMDSWIFNDQFSNGEFTWVIPWICANVGLCYS